jgi:short-subunit dehydrogenase
MPLPETIYGEPASIMITGASSGIGAALAEHLGRYRGRLALLARRGDELRSIAEKMRAAGADRVLAVPCDVTDPGAVRRAHETIVAAHGPVDVAFLNAGMGGVTSVARFDAQRLRSMFEVNVFGVAYWLEALFPPMTGRGRGIIAVTSSLAAAVGLPGAGGYGATKSALSSLCESLRAEAGQAGVQLTTVEPGFVRSAMTAKNPPMPFLLEPDEAARIIADEVAEGRPVVRFPWQMAAAIQVISHLPASVFDRLALKLVGKPKR